MAFWPKFPTGNPELSSQEEQILTSCSPVMVEICGMRAAARADRIKAKSGLVHHIVWDEEESGYWPEDQPVRLTSDGGAIINVEKMPRSCSRCMETMPPEKLNSVWMDFGEDVIKSNVEGLPDINGVWTEVCDTCFEKDGDTA